MAPAGPARPAAAPPLARLPRRPRRPTEAVVPAAAAEDPRVLLGRRVNGLRVGRGISQEEFADRVGLDRTYVSGIERGLRNPTLLVLLRLARALGVTTATLLDGLDREGGG